MYDCCNKWNCWLFYIECLPEDGMYFIVSPKDIVTARQRDEDDHISWLLEHEMFVVNKQCHSSTIKFCCAVNVFVSCHCFDTVGTVTAIATDPSLATWN